MNYALGLLFGLCLFSIAVLTMAGVSYVVVGSGLHPYAACAGMGLFALIGYAACSIIDAKEEAL